MRPAQVAKGLLAFALTSLGCQSLIGVEERHLGDEPRCVDYCDTVMDKCAGADKVYSSRDTCLSVCRILEPGGPSDPAQANTVFCRDTLIKNSTESDVDCSLAGPGGGNQCGSDCESYCQIWIASCPDIPTHDLDECVRQCGALERELGGFSVSSLSVKGDSFQCRLYYASEASLDPANCQNAAIAPATSLVLCTDPPTGPPNCKDYCRITMVACTGDNALYESDDQCLAACEALPPGMNADSNGDIKNNTLKNTIGCRKFHAYGALGKPQFHCGHSGPTSDGYCGDEEHTICESHCLIAKKACGEAYAATYATDSDCQAECETLPGVTEDGAEETGYEYSLPKAKEGGRQVPCRTLHALRVADGTAAAETDCPIALGTADCPAE